MYQSSVNTAQSIFLVVITIAKKADALEQGPTIENNMHNDNNIKALRARMIAADPSLGSTTNIDKWWLLGTSGCHLCDTAEQLLTQFQAVHPLTYQYVDIADFDEELMMTFAHHIPVILTPSKRLDYPFSVMDLQQLYS